MIPHRPRKRRRGVESLRLISLFLLILPSILGSLAASPAALDPMRKPPSPNAELVEERLSLASCRRLSGVSTGTTSDAELLRVRDQLYSIADCVVRLCESRGVALTEEAALVFVEADEREAVLERAAILEFDAGRTRSEATRVALSAYVRARLKAEGSES